jgi:hypothetical protein
MYDFTIWDVTIYNVMIFDCKSAIANRTIEDHHIENPMALPA